MFKKEKILLAGGCSYTDPNFFSADETIPDHQRGGWKMWPEIVAEELNLKCVNYGQSGVSNDYILQEILKGISTYRDRIDTVAILLTAAERYKFFNLPFNPPTELSLKLDENTKFFNKGFKWIDNYGGDITVKYWQSEGFSDKAYKYMIEHFYHNILLMIKACEPYNINLVIMQGISPFSVEIYNHLYNSGKLKHPGPTWKLLAKWAIDSPNFQEIEDKYSHKIIGWPILDNIGGFYYTKLRDYSNTRVSEKDPHPNSKGQLDIAKFYLERLKK